MPRTKEQIDNINVARKDAGLETVPYEHEATSQASETTGATTSAQETNTTTAAAQESATTQTATTTTTENNQDDDNDEVLLEKLKKRGFNVSSLEDLKPKPTPADVETQKKERDSKKLSFGLEKKIFTAEEYQSYLKDYNDPLAVVYDDFRQDLLTAEPEITDSEIRERFQEEYHQEDDQDASRFKRGKKAIETLAEKLIREKHGNVLRLDQTYESHEKEVEKSTEATRKVQAAIPVYKGAVKSALEANKKIPVKFSDTETYEVEVNPVHLKEIEDGLLIDDTMIGHINRGTAPETLARAVKMAIIERGFDEYVKGFADKYLIEHAKGTKGVPSLTRAHQDAGNKKVFTENQKKVLDEQGMSHVYSQTTAS